MSSVPATAPTTETSRSTPGPSWARALRRLADHLSCDLGGGPRPLKLAWVINAQKGGTFAFLGLLLWWYRPTSAAAWVYVALQGGYGLVWLMKDLAFPDPSWQRRITIGGAFGSFFGVLAWYWLFGWLIVSGTAHGPYPLPEPVWLCLCVTLCLVGTAVMIAADAQKYFTLRLRRGLITDGMFRYVRHPNYLGEMLIYGSFALLVWHWIPVLVLAWVWGALFAVNMVLKEASMARYPEWADYRRRTGWLLPKLRAR